MTSLDWFCILAGFAVGSFIAAAFDRQERLLHILTGPSACNSCGTRLNWHSLVPIISFVSQAGKCRYCQSAIPLRYPVTEFAGGMIALLAVRLAPDQMVVISCLFGWLLLALCLHDWMTFRLPDYLTFCLAGLGLFIVWRHFPSSWPAHLSGGVIAYATFRFIEAAYLQLKGRHGLGRGDTKLFGAIGIWIGVSGLAPALLIASTGALCHVLIATLRSGTKLKPTHKIAFGPWIAAGGFLTWLWQIMA